MYIPFNIQLTLVQDTIFIFGKICDIHKADALITDPGITDTDFKILSDIGIEVIITDN